MTGNEILDRLGTIEKNQRKSERQSSIAFGITIMVIGWNFLGTAEPIHLKVASSILIILGFWIMLWGVRRSRFRGKPKS